VESTASSPVFMFYAPGHSFGSTEGVGSHFHVLRSRTSFRRYRRRRVLFSCFTLPYSFSAVPRASGPVIKFCTPGPIFGGTDGVGSSFHVLRFRTHFRRYRGRRSLALELVMHMLSHLSSHLLQTPWREVRMTLLNFLLHFSFLLPFQVVLFHIFIFFCFRRALVTALIMDCLCFPDHEAPSLETTRDDILTGSPALMDITISGFCTDLVVVGSCASLVFGC
jgi:hypothetical protein